jgi:hypothetical protein
MTTQPVEQHRPDNPSAGRPLAFDSVIGAIYRIAFGRPGDHDVFRNALVRWTDFVGPLVVLVVITVGYQLASNPAVLRTMNASFNATVIVLGLGIAGAGLRALIGLGVTFGLAKGTVAPERLAPGLLAYAWMQAALVAPLMIVGHRMSTGGGPTWMIITFGLGLLLFIIVGATRVMRVAFGLSNAAWGGVLAFAGMLVSYAVDRIIPW